MDRLMCRRRGWKRLCSHLRWTLRHGWIACTTLIAVAITALAVSPAVAADAAAAGYGPTARPAVPFALWSLPPGAVQPAGWLRDWSVAARDGLTGHLDEHHAVFADAWKGFRINAPNAAADGTGWPLEQCSYWLDGALRLGLVMHDEPLVRKIRARLDPIVDGVHKAPFGTSLIHWKKDFKPTGFNSWAHSQMGRALVALYQGTGERRVLDALVKVYADYPTKMGPVHFGDVTGLCNLDAMLEAYAASGDRRLLDRALAAAAQPDVVADFRAWTQQRLAPGHMVILYENIRLPGILYPWSGDEGHLQATLGALQWIDRNHMLPYGVSSGEEFASGVGAFRKTETCDVTAMLLTTSWMYRIRGDGDFGDRMERAFFNAGCAPVARDFKSMCYYQSPNRLRSDSLPCEQPMAPGREGVRFHPLGCPSVLCCAGAVHRILPNFVIHMWMATPDRGLAATLHGPATVTARVADGVPVTIATTTDYPFAETIRMTISPQRTVDFPLYVRVPGWCRGAKIAVCGAEVPAAPDAKGFVKLARRWAAGDEVTLTLPMTPRVEHGWETEFPAANREYFSFEPASLFVKRRLPYADVVFGPLLFALPIRDLTPNTPAPDAKWQYALDVASDAADPGIAVERRAMPPRWDWPLDAPLSLTAPVRRFDWHPTDAQALPERPVAGGTPEQVRLVPYACTKFRISMFPVTEKTLGNRKSPD